VQRLSAGRGARHVERNASVVEPLRFVQMWLLPDRSGTEPTYESDLPLLRSGGWTDVAGGSAAVGMGSRGATLRVARLEAGESVIPPASGWCHLFVTAGSVAVQDIGVLGDGDSLRLTRRRPLLRAQAPAELLAWQLRVQRPASR
jgi:redox-sensitive bicupin YhaK (pirin superfamily)